jgi:hypothetical protein
MATPEPRLDLQLSGEMATLQLSPELSMPPVSLHYGGMREFSDLLEENDGDVLGVVLATHSSSGIVVTRYEPLRSTPGIDPHDLVGVRESVFQLTEKCAREADPEFGRPVGLFRTQQGGRACLTDFDIKLVRRCLPNFGDRGKLFLVIRNFPNRPRSGAVFPLDSGLFSVTTRPAAEFPFDEYLLRKGYLTDSADPVPSAAVAPRVAVPPPVQISGPQLAGRRNGMLVACLVLLAFLVGAGLWRWSRTPVQRPRTNDVQDDSAPSRSLSLKVARSGNDMEISWDRAAVATMNASGGTLTIRDGPIVRVVALNSDQLREGHIWFAPLPGSDLDLRFEITKTDGKTQAESVQVLSWDSASPVVASVKPPQVPDSWRDRTTEAFKKLPATPPAAQPPVQAPVQAPIQAPVQTPVQAPVQPLSQATAPPPAQSPVQSPPPEPVNTAPPAPITQVASAHETSPLPQAAPPPEPVRNVAAAPIPAPAPPPAEQPKLIANQYAAPTILRKVIPNLTPEAKAELRRTARKVSVSVRLDIDEAGAVRNAEATGTTGDPASGGVYVKLISTAAARQWKFRPATINGKNVPSQMTVVFEY